MSCDNNKNIKPWKLIPLDLENCVILKPNSDDVRPIPIFSEKPLKDPRSSSVKIPSAPKIYFSWPHQAPSSYQQEENETKFSEYFEFNSTPHKWHTPVGEPYSYNYGPSDVNRSMTKSFDDNPQPGSYELEDGEIPPWDDNNDVSTPGPMVKRFRTKK